MRHNSKRQVAAAEASGVAHCVSRQPEAGDGQHRHEPRQRLDHYRTAVALDAQRALPRGGWCVSSNLAALARWWRRLRTSPRCTPPSTSSRSPTSPTAACSRSPRRASAAAAAKRRAKALIGPAKPTQWNPQTRRFTKITARQPRPGGHRIRRRLAGWWCAGAHYALHQGHGQAQPACPAGRIGDGKVLCEPEQREIQFLSNPGQGGASCANPRGSIPRSWWGSLDFLDFLPLFGFWNLSKSGGQKVTLEPSRSIHVRPRRC